MPRDQHQPRWQCSRGTSELSNDRAHENCRPVARLSIASARRDAGSVIDAGRDRRPDRLHRDAPLNRVCRLVAGPGDADSSAQPNCCDDGSVEVYGFDSGCRPSRRLSTKAITSTDCSGVRIRFGIFGSGGSQCSRGASELSDHREHQNCRPVARLSVASARRDAGSVVDAGRDR